MSPEACERLILSIEHHGEFPGSDFFSDGSLGFDDAGLLGAIATYDKPEDEDGDAGEVITQLEDIAEEYPEESVDAILIHRMKTLDWVVKSDVYQSVPILFGAHLYPSSSHRKNKWRNAVTSGRDIFVFCGSVRSLRNYSAFGNGNVSWVVAPIMGLSEDTLPSPEPSLDKEYDIGFFSQLSHGKRPHEVLLTARQASQEFDRRLDVWIAGFTPSSDSYYQKVQWLADKPYFDCIDIEFTGRLSKRELFERVQKTRAIHLPSVYTSETTCYAAWEAVSYGVPLVGADWAGIGEAARHGVNSASCAVPVRRVTSISGYFPDELVNKSPSIPDKFSDHLSMPYMADMDIAADALINAINSANTNAGVRPFHIPQRVHSETTIDAFADIVNGEFCDRSDMVKGYTVSSGLTQDHKASYETLRDPFYSSVGTFQTLIDLRQSFSSVPEKDAFSMSAHPLTER